MRRRPYLHHAAAGDTGKGAEVWWSWKITLPTERGQVDYGLLVEEIELMAADIETGVTPAQACGDLKFDTTLQARDLYSRT